MTTTAYDKSWDQGGRGWGSRHRRVSSPLCVVFSFFFTILISFYSVSTCYNDNDNIGQELGSGRQASRAPGHFPTTTMARSIGLETQACHESRHVFDYFILYILYLYTMYYAKKKELKHQKLCELMSPNAPKMFGFGTQGSGSL